MKFKIPYTYALSLALTLTILSTVAATLSYYVFFKEHFIISLLTFTITVFIISLVFIQKRTEKILYKNIDELYNKVANLDNTSLPNQKSKDFESLSKQVKEYVEGKQTEIKNLTDRDSFRRDFLGNVAHELKTPLFTVQGYILTLIEGASSDKMLRDKYLLRANKGVERLVSVVKDLDMIAKLETEGVKMKIEAFNILEVIQNVFDLFEMRAKKRNITLHFDRVYEFPVFVTGDRERIEQVLINLIVNSIKYGKIGGLTTVSVLDLNQNQFLVKVIDNGEGIKEEHQTRLFERFYRVDQSRSREQGGSGLGLSIVKHIIEAHNQSINMSSEFGKGSEFSFTLEKAK